MKTIEELQQIKKLKIIRLIDREIKKCELRKKTYEVNKRYHRALHTSKGLNIYGMIVKYYHHSDFLDFLDDIIDEEERIQKSWELVKKYILDLK